MTCRIDRRLTEKGLLLYVSGRLASEDLEVLRTALEGSRVVTIDLSEVELVDRDSVRFMAKAEAEGIELRNSPPYIRQWITNERTSN
jgi:hypothetical protein